MTTTRRILTDSPTPTWDPPDHEPAPTFRVRTGEEIMRDYDPDEDKPRCSRHPKRFADTVHIVDGEVKLSCATRGCDWSDEYWIPLYKTKKYVNDPLTRHFAEWTNHLAESHPSRVLAPLFRWLSTTPEGLYVLRHVPWQR